MQEDEEGKRKKEERMRERARRVLKGEEKWKIGPGTEAAREALSEVDEELSISITQHLPQIDRFCGRLGGLHRPLRRWRYFKRTYWFGSQHCLNVQRSRTPAGCCPFQRWASQLNVY